jgi:AcrR family transcriptional regulator
MTQAERSAATVTAILASARRLFAREGFDHTSIDRIADEAGIAKGAVYHHFRSKNELFERVFNELLADIARSIQTRASGRDAAELMLEGTRLYLEAVSSSSARRILLIDGPSVLGWQKWREIDLHHFGQSSRFLLRGLFEGRASEPEIEALFHLITGAVTEAALLCASARNRTETLHNLMAALRRLLTAIRPS